MQVGPPGVVEGDGTEEAAAAADAALDEERFAGGEGTDGDAGGAVLAVDAAGRVELPPAGAVDGSEPAGEWLLEDFERRMREARGQGARGVGEVGLVADGLDDERGEPAAAGLERLLVPGFGVAAVAEGDEHRAAFTGELLDGA